MNYINYGYNTRLGNWFFQVAFARLLGPAPIAFYVRPEISFKRLEAFHELWPDVTFTHDLPEGVSCFKESELIANDFRLPKQRDNLLLDGYFQFPELFNRQALSLDFACPPRIKTIIDEKFGSLLTEPLLVGVSVRRGDYLTLPHQHPFVGKRYLRTAVEKFDASALYVVCSDDIPWCRTFFTGRNFPGRRFAFIEGEEVLTQLYIHTFCHHNILSNSTFSWWGAYFNVHDNRRVIFPSMWNGIQNRESKTYLYLADAEIIENHYTPGMYFKAVALCAKRRLGDVLRALGLWGRNDQKVPIGYR